MTPGTVFRLNEPITDLGYNLADFIPVDGFPVYGVVCANNTTGTPASIVYYWHDGLGKWRPRRWNWMHKHLEKFEEVHID